MGNLRQAVHKAIAFIGGIGMCLLVFLAIMTSGDVVLRLIFGYTIIGAHEIVEFLLSSVVFFGMAHTAMSKGHICVDLFFAHFPHKVQLIIDSITNLFSLVVCGLITWQVFLYGIEMFKADKVSATINIPIYPCIFMASIGMAFLTLVLIEDETVYLRGLFSNNAKLESMSDSSNISVQ